MKYRMRLVPDEGQYVLLSPDFPEAISCATDREDAHKQATEVLLATLHYYIAENKTIPAASRKTASAKEIVVHLPSYTFFAVELYRVMRKKRVSRLDLAERMGVHMPQVNRLLDPRYRSTLSQIEKAFAVLGEPLELKRVS